MTTNADLKQKLFVRIILAAAWADGKLEPQELTYLQGLLAAKGVGPTRELEALLHAPPEPEQMELWLVQYLACTDVPERLEALSQIAKLLMSDGVVSSSEHDFLDEIHQLMAQIPPQSNQVHKKAQDSLLSSLGRAIRNGLKHRDNDRK